MYLLLPKILRMPSNSRDLQQRIPNELLSALATSLVEGPIFEIVTSLTEVQNVTEKQLFRERLQVLRGHSREYSLIFNHKLCTSFADTFQVC